MKSKVTIAVLLLLLAGAVALVVYIRNHGFSAKEEPSWLEKVLAQHARKIATPAEAKTLKNPEPINEPTMTEAREHFVEHCAACHRLDGRGETTFGRNMYPKVPDLTDAQPQRLADGNCTTLFPMAFASPGCPRSAAKIAPSPSGIW